MSGRSAGEIAARHPPDAELLGLPVHSVDVEQLHDFIAETIAKNQKAVVLHLNVHGVNLALKHRWFHEFVHAAQLVFCDGDGVRLGLRILGYSAPPKITYNEWLWQLSAFCESRKLRLFLLGGKPGVADEAGQRLKARYPQLDIVGTHDGYFDKQDEGNRRVVDKINAASPDLLLVCFGMPLQESWVSANWADLEARVFLTGGAALDYASSRLKKAPSWMIRLHLEWLFRLRQEPRRLFTRYVFGNPLFLFRVLVERGRRVFRGI